MDIHGNQMAGFEKRQICKFKVLCKYTKIWTCSLFVIDDINDQIIITRTENGQLLGLGATNQ